jgi:hypothetical protein
MKDVANALKEPYLVEGTAIESHLGRGAHADERVAKTLANVAKALPDAVIQLEHDRRFRFGKETAAAAGGTQQPPPAADPAPAATA